MLAILGFGSLISEPGEEIEAAADGPPVGTETPFPVEFARVSVCRGGAPTLVRVKDGIKVKAVLFRMKNGITEQEACDMLWRRETDQVGSKKQYKRPTKPTVNSVLIETWKNFAGIETVLYTDFLDSGKLQSPTAKQLAEMAINSAKASGVKEGKDGITYLRRAIDAGVNTRLTQDYQAEILKATRTTSLQEALAKLASKSSPPLDDALVDKALLEEESYTFDCKRLKDKLAKILETVVAFANSDGGVIALGLEDPDKAQGRDRVYGIQENLMNWDELRRLMLSRITESGLLAWNPHEVGCTLRDGTIGSVVFLRIEKSTRIHSIVDDGTFIRLQKGNKQLTAPEINELSFARGTITAESQLESVDFDLLDTDYWRAYAQQRRLTRPIAEAMLHVGLAKRSGDGRVLPTRAAVLLFAEEPGGLLAAKAAVRVFHYRGHKVQTDPNTNLLKPPSTISGPVIRQIQDATEVVVRELASGIQMGPLGFEIVQQYPVRVIKEAITNAVIHRDYHLMTDVHIRIFSDRIEVDSPGLFAGPVTIANIGQVGAFNRNPVLVSHLREFPNPPNLDAGEGVRMMFGTMRETGLYPPLYDTRPHVERDAVIVTLFNENRPSLWEQVSQYVDQHGSIGNAELRQLMGTENVLGVSKLIRDWVDRGLLVVANPEAGTRVRRYAKPGSRRRGLVF